MWSDFSLNSVYSYVFFRQGFEDRKHAKHAFRKRLSLTGSPPVGWMFKRFRCVQSFQQAVFGSKESPTLDKVSHTAGRLWARSGYRTARLKVKSASSAELSHRHRLLPSRLTTRCNTVSPPLMAPFSVLSGGTGAEHAVSRRDQEVQPGVFR